MGPAGVSFPVTLNKVMPGFAESGSVVMDRSKIPSGKVQLRVGIPNPLKGGRPFRFANEDAEPTRPGWLTLGTLTIP